MPFYDIEYRRPVVQPSIPQDRIVETPWRLMKRFFSDTSSGALREFKALQLDFMGYEPEIRSIGPSAESTPLEELGALL